DPMPPGPIKLCVYGNFFAGPPALRVAPKAAVKSYFPWWSFLWRGRVHILIVVIIYIGNGRKIKRRLELFYIVKGIFHWFKVGFCPSSVQHGLLLWRRRAIH